MNSQSGQAITETLIIIPVLLLGGLLCIETVNLILIKSSLAMKATERAQILSGSELQWVKLENLKPEQLGSDSTPSVRFYVTQVNTPTPGISVQINACVPLIGQKWTNSRSSQNANAVPRDCLGMFESASFGSLFRSGVVRIRVSAFAPRQMSYAIYHHGLELPETWK